MNVSHCHLRVKLPRCVGFTPAPIHIKEVCSLQGSRCTFACSSIEFAFDILFIQMILFCFKLAFHKALNNPGRFGLAVKSRVRNLDAG